MNRSYRIRAWMVLATIIACSVPVLAQAQAGPPPANPQATPVGGSAAVAPVAPPGTTPVAPPVALSAAPPLAQGHWVYVQDAPAPTAVSTATAKRIQLGPVYTKANTWDLNIDGAVGRYFGDEDRWTGFVRARAGVLFVREPLYSAIGFTYEYSSLANATFGIQAEVLHLDSGFWGQVGGLLDTKGNPGVMAAIGFSVIGVEAQYRAYPGLGDGVAIYAKIRVPVGVLAYVLGVRDRSKTTSPAPAAPPP
jgi:hypothetical protein